ncbi:hypothetical protein HAX54_024754, partial [Datura stramonium]|nr:hypothetical protein [Datura stramonium]
GQIEGCSSSPADPLFMRQCNAAEKGKPLFISKLLPSRKLRSNDPLVVLHFVIFRLSLRFSDSRDPMLISDLNVSSRFGAAHLISSAITAGNPSGCSAA